LTTWTTISWPSRSSSVIGGTAWTVAAGVWATLGAATATASPSPSTALSSAVSSTASTGAWLLVRTMSLACRKAARSSPISTNAACMPGITRCTRPL